MDNFKEMMSSAAAITESSTKAKPVFENVPEKLRDFASKTMNVLGATAKLSFDSIAHLNVKEMKEMVKRTSKANPLNLNT